YALTAEERACMDRLRHSFMSSQKLWEHMHHMVSRGSMYAIRDDHLIFHGCISCDAKGEFLPLTVDGAPRTGRALFDALNGVIFRGLEQKRTEDLDLLWYLWGGPRSPLFGKDRIATFERDFIADKKPHEEHKDPYFSLINDAGFCDKVMREFGV